MNLNFMQGDLLSGDPIIQKSRELEAQREQHLNDLISKEIIAQLKDQYGTGKSQMEESSKLADQMRTWMWGDNVPQGYGAGNTLGELEAMFNQEYGRAPRYNSQTPTVMPQNQQPQPQNAEEGKSIANANFARGAIAYHSQLTDNQSRNFGMQLLQLKQQWDALEGLKHQHDAILKNPTASDEDKQYAQQQIDAANQSQMQIHQRAEQLRTQGERLGIPLDMVGSGTTLNDAETNIGFEFEKAIRDMFVDKYSRNSADYYSQRYNEYRNQGLSKRHARERADADATQYQYDRMNAANDMFATFGTNGGQLTDYGVRLAKILAEEGDPSAAELFMNGYATPYQAWGKNQDRIDAAKEHEYSEDTADNKLLRTQALALFQNNIDEINRNVAHEQKKDLITHAGNINLRNQTEDLWTQARIAELASDKTFAQQVQRLAMLRGWQLEDEEVKRTLENAKAQKIFTAAVAAGMPEAYAALLSLGVIDPNKLASKGSSSSSGKTGNDKPTDKEIEARNIVQSYDDDIDTLINAGKTKEALVLIEEIEERLKEDDMRKYDGDIMTDFKRRNMERRQKIADLFKKQKEDSADKNGESNSNQPKTETPVNQDQTVSKSVDQTESRFRSPYDGGYTPGGRTKIGDPKLPDLYGDIGKWIRDTWFNNSPYWGKMGY